MIQHATIAPTPETGPLIDAELPRFSVLGVHIHNATRQQAIALIERAIVRRDGRPKSVFFVNAHTLNLAAADPSYRDTLNSGDCVFADGTGVRWAARLQGVRVRENLPGTDVVPAMFRDAPDRGYSYYLLGADAMTIAVAADYARCMFPGWRQAGSRHGYLSDDALTSAAIGQINATRPDVLLVGMGNPLQEQWIQRHLSRLNVSVCLGVGGLFDFWAGNVSRAPRWLRRMGHEWLWRLLQQPRQKARRYLLGNPLFLARVLRNRQRL
jgi:N-acetylglucosaminyldiphosphoundecaprenol N-acetyl-beta-D-mannosaminyltransferase